MVPEAIRYYHDLLSGEYLKSTRELLTAHNEQLSVAGRPVCTVLRPFFITESAYAKVRTASTLVMRGIRVLAEQLRTDATLRARMDLTPEEEAIVSIDTGYGASDVSARLDGFPAGDQFHFVEYNADSPGGLGYGDVLSEVFGSMPLMEEFGKRFPFRSIPVRARAFDALMSAYRRWGGRALPSIAIIDWKNVSTYPEFLLFQEEFECRGCRVRIGSPEELEYHNGRLYIADFPVDLIYKRLVVGELLARIGINHPLVDAVRDRAVCCVNGFSVQMTFKKALFALLHENVSSGLFDSEVSGAVRKHIPWTRILQECHTDYEGKSVDLIPHVLANRESLVLKPNAEYGGRGVVLGWECSEARWHDAVQSAFSSCHVVQERVPVQSGLYPELVDGALQFDQRFFDLDPYVWEGSQVEGCGVRLSRAALLNVASGGSATPMLILK